MSSGAQLALWGIVRACVRYMFGKKFPREFFTGEICERMSGYGTVRGGNVRGEISEKGFYLREGVNF